MSARPGAWARLIQQQPWKYDRIPFTHHLHSFDSEVHWESGFYSCFLMDYRPRSAFVLGIWRVCKLGELLLMYGALCTAKWYTGRLFILTINCDESCIILMPVRHMWTGLCLIKSNNAREFDRTLFDIFIAVINYVTVNELETIAPTPKKTKQMRCTGLSIYFSEISL